MSDKIPQVAVPGTIAIHGFPAQTNAFVPISVPVTNVVGSVNLGSAATLAVPSANFSTYMNMLPVDPMSGLPLGWTKKLVPTQNPNELVSCLCVV